MTNRKRRKGISGVHVSFAFSMRGELALIPARSRCGLPAFRQERPNLHARTTHADTRACAARKACGDVSAASGKRAIAGIANSAHADSQKKPVR